MFPRLITPFLLLISLLLSAEDQNSEITYLRGLVDSNIFSSNTFQSKFEQILRDEKGEIIDKMEGIISLDKPNSFRWHYMYPYEQIIIGNGIKIVSHDIDLNSITIRDYSNINNTAPIIMLQGNQFLDSNLELGDSYYDSEGFLWLTLQYLINDDEKYSFDVAFNNEVIAKMVIKDSLNQNMTINFFDPSFNKDLNSDLFDIETIIIKSNKEK